MAGPSVSAYALVQATVRALYSGMLTPKTWESLVRAEHLDAVLSILADTVYGPHLQLERQALTPRRTVYQIRLHLAESYEKLIRLTPDQGRPLLLQMWQVYEVDNLKATLRGIETHASWDQVRRVLSPMRKYITVTMDDMERMILAGDIGRAIERIRHTHYYDTLLHALERYQAETSLFPLEVALDLDYRRRLWQAIHELKGSDYEQAQRLVGTALDIDNVLWAGRYHVYHHLSEEEIINYTLPFGHKVLDKHIRAIARGEDVGQIAREVFPKLEWSDRSATKTDHNLMDLERALQRYLIGLCRATFLSSPFHIGLPVAYLLLSEYEIAELTTLIEAKASGLPLGAFESVLIGLATG